MRVLHVVTRWLRGGTERNILASIGDELDRGHQVGLAVGSTSELSGVPSAVDVIQLDALVREVNLANDMRAFRALDRLYERWKPDVVHTHQSKAGIVGRAAASRHRGVVVGHTVHMASFGPGYGRLTSMAFRAAERWCGKRTDLVMTVGSELADIYIDHRVVGVDKVLVVRSPVELEEYDAARERRGRTGSAWRERLRIDPDEVVLVAAGALEPRKRQHLLVSAMAELDPDPRVRLLVAGDGPSRSPLEDQVARSGLGGRVHFLGHVAALADVFAASDVFVHASTAEGVPQVMVQALAAGLGVVTCDVEGVSELPSDAIRLARRSGVDLTDLIRAAVVAPAPSCSLDELAPWADAAVVAQRREALERLESLAKVSTATASIPRSPVGPVSVVIPTHDRPRLLGEALDSVASQTLLPDEVWVVSDTGDDEDRRVVGERGANAPYPIHYLSDPSDAGVARSRNIGAARATGAVVAFLDDDDRWAPNYLQRATTHLAATNAGFCVVWAESFRGDRTAPGASMPPRLGVGDVLVMNPGFTGSNVVLRRSVLDEVGGFDESLWVSNDKDLLVRLLDAGVGYCVVTERLAQRRVDGTPRLGTAGKIRLEGLQRYLDKHSMRMTRAQRRYLRARMERIRRRSAATQQERVVATAKMLLFLGPTGVRRVRKDDERTAVP